MQHLSKSKADWENLFPELLAAIAKRLTSIWDYTSFRGVCKSWQSAATLDNFDHEFPQVPWLMYNTPEKEEINVVFVTKFVDLSRKKIFRIANLQKTDEESIKRYLSSSGWLLGVAKSSVNLHLTHPIRHNIPIKLPDLDTFPGYSNNLSRSHYSANLRNIIGKMALSGSPTIVSDLVIMAIWGDKRQLAFSRPGDSCWTLMEFWDGSFTDILYHNEKLYAIDNKLRVHG